MTEQAHVHEEGGGRWVGSNKLVELKKEKSLRFKTYSICIFKNYCVGAQLVYYAVLISAVQQSASLKHVGTFCFIFFSIVVYHRLLNTVACATQQDLAACPVQVVCWPKCQFAGFSISSYGKSQMNFWANLIQQFASENPRFSIHPSSTRFPLSSHKSALCESVNCFTTMRYHLTSVIKKSANNKCQRRHGEKGTLLYCSWECKLVTSLWRSVWRSLKKTKNRNAI